MKRRSPGKKTKRSRSSKKLAAYPAFVKQMMKDSKIKKLPHLSRMKAIAVEWHKKGASMKACPMKKSKRSRKSAKKSNRRSAKKSNRRSATKKSKRTKRRRSSSKKGKRSPAKGIKAWLDYFKKS